MFRKSLLAVTALAMVAIGTAACGTEEATPEASALPKPTFAAGTTMAKLSEAQKIRVGTKFDQPGFGLKGLDGKPAGFDVEIAKLIASELGIPADKIEWTETKSAIREEVLEQDKVDLVAATYTINDARKQRIAFAGPYYVAGQHLMVKASDNSITGPDSFKAGDKKVCSVTGSTPLANIKKFLKDEATQLVAVGAYSECVTALNAGQVDAVTTDNVILLGFVANSNGTLKMAGSKFTDEPYGIGVKKDDTEFRTFINDVLEKIYEDGRYAKAWADTAGKFDPTVPTGPAVNRY